MHVRVDDLRNGVGRRPTAGVLRVPRPALVSRGLALWI